MSCSVEEWLLSGLYARVNGLRLRPLEHRQLKKTPVAIQRGQAKAYILQAENGDWYILKKFLSERALDCAYLLAVRQCLPVHDGLRCGTERELLKATHHVKEGSLYYSAKLAAWLDGTILMPRVPGIDWAGLADDLRDGSRQADRMQRVSLCRGLATLIAQLEEAQCSHRDLASGNVFIDWSSQLVSLIDFDSLYHPSLQMPRGTTCGTPGYTPGFAWVKGNPSASATWCLGADRFSLSVLCVEFLILGQGAPFTSEGGMFLQKELCAGKGKGLDHIRKELTGHYPDAAPLLDKAIQSRDSAQCPSPQDWLALCDRLIGPVIRPPSLSDVEALDAAVFEQILRRCKPPAPIWPAPHLDQLPTATLELPKTTAPVVSLPQDPWRT